LKKLLLFLLITCNSFALFAQSKIDVEEIEQSTSNARDEIYQKLKQTTGMSETEFDKFREYYVDIIANDLNSVFNYYETHNTPDAAYLDQLETGIVNKYARLFNEFRDLEVNSPSKITESIKPRRFLNPTGTCNPANDNLGFENGTLSGWTCGYADCSSESMVTCSPGPAAFSYSPVTWQVGTGRTKAGGPDSSTGNDYQVTIESGGKDTVTGIPKVCPGFKYSAMIGDSIAGAGISAPNFGVAFLKQSFTVSDTNSYFYYSFAIVLENPSHCYHQQPYFIVAVLAQNGDTIVSTDYLEVAGAVNGVGWQIIQQDINGYQTQYLPWTTCVVHLQKYMGQCVTVIAIASDCGQGGHFGYAYFDSRIGKPQITVSPTAVCNLPVTLTAPSGASSYQWTGPGISCVTSAGNTQAISGTCAGKYSVIMKNIYGLTADTLDTVITVASPTVSITGKDSVIVGLPDTLIASGATNYTWNTNSTSDTLIVSPTTATTYTVYGTSANKCSDSATFTVNMQVLTGINNLTNNNSIVLFPNPFSVSTTILFNEAGTHYLELYDITGRKLDELQCSGKECQFSRNGLAQGVYLLKAFNAQMKYQASLKVVIE